MTIVLEIRQKLRLTEGELVALLPLATHHPEKLEEKIMRYRTPGEHLFSWILERYKRQTNSDNTWIDSMSHEFAMPDLEDLLIRSTCLMIVRRLLWNANWYHERFIDEDIVIGRFERDYLLGVFGLVKETRRELSIIVFSALRASKQQISKRLYDQILERASRSRQRCEIGGCRINYNATDVNDFSAFSLDHIWPQSLGGTSEEANLRVSCRDCNNRRKNIAEVSDVHYEHFHVKSEWSQLPQSSFLAEFSKDFRLAVLLRAGHRCEMCGTSVDGMDSDLDFLKPNQDENYNVFNVRVACSTHRARS